LRFAFYGRISTSEYQDPVSSRGWQVEAAQRLVAGRGRIVVEFFDPGASRSVPWLKRPQAAALLAAAAEPDRGFDAVVVGEFERAFAGGEARRVIEALASCGVQLWLPEAEGPVDLDEPEHRALLMMLGHQSQREVLRTRFRVRSAMAAQVREQGRHQGGRPPYGYQLVDAGPHPNQVKASWGRRRHRLEVDPVTAPHVRWIFARRLEGMSAAGIARELNERRIPSPGVYGRVRNPHRARAPSRWGEDSFGFPLGLRTPPLPAAHAKGGARQQARAWDYATDITSALLTASPLAECDIVSQRQIRMPVKRRVSVPKRYLRRHAGTDRATRVYELRAFG
jgi:DNA invertase Pin-like site-specific DNA recombinase